MKKINIKITAVSVFSFINVIVLAQTGDDKKPKIDESSKTTGQEKTPAPFTTPQNVATPKALTVDVQPKPIVPGGEFKPMDTNKPLALKTELQETVIDQPILMPALKKAGPPPVVTEQNVDPAAQERQKPATLQPILIKQQ